MFYLFSSSFLPGLTNRYIAIILFTWIQTRTPKEMPGRIMSIIMFSSIGLIPVSQAISGAVSKWNLTFLFASVGTLVFLVSIWVAFRPEMKSFSESLTKVKAEEDS